MLRKYLCFIILAGIMTGSVAKEKYSNPVVDLSTLINLSSLVEKVSDKRVVFVGESHDQYQHHLNQLSIIKGLHAKHSDLGIGLEFFFQPYQKYLDRYIAREIDEAELIRKTEYFNRWRFDYRLYRPIFRFARAHGIPLIALNLESEITRLVGQKGIDNLSDEMKQRIPTEIDRGNQAYRDRLKTVFDAHPSHEGSSFEHFLDVQLLWDEGMAEQAAKWLRDNPERNMVILAGAGHLIYGNGIPNRLARRIDASQAIIMNVNDSTELDPELADYLILAGNERLPPSGKLGIFLDVNSSPLVVSGFSDGSGAAEAGLKEKDQLISIDGQPIDNYTDLRIALMDREVGDTVEVQVERERLFIGALVETYQVSLH